MKVQAIECTRCKGELKEKGKYWECPYCGAKFSVQLDADGDQIIYRNDDPKELPCGQVAERAAQISVDKITTVDIKPPKSIESDVYQSSDDLDYYDNVNLIVTYLNKEKWDIAQDNICKLRNLNDPCSTAVADWYGMAWEHKAHNDSELVHSFTAITDDELQKLYNLLLNAMPDFRKRILDLVLNSGYVGDEPTNKILVTTLPFLFSELIYSPEERDEKIEIIFDKTISLKYAETFKYLLTHALESHEVDRYIGYLERFADNCDPESSQEYYSMIISVDPGNAQAHHSLVKADIKANSSAQKCIDDFENLLLYSQDPIKDVETFITVLINEQTTTEDKAEFMWALLSYLHEDTETQTEAMSLYANLLLQSELWNRASEFYSAVLSRDTRNAKVYFNLCLADMQAKDSRELISKEDDFSGHPYYKKALAQAYKTNKIYAKELEELIDARDKRIKDDQTRIANKKKKIKKTILSVTIIALIIGGFIGFKMYTNDRKYSEENISLTVTDKGYPDNATNTSPCHFILDVNIQNSSSLAITRIDGIMRYYSANGKLLHESNVWLTGNLESGKDYNYELEIEQDPTAETTELHNTPLSELKITWELTSVTYENNSVKEYTSGKAYTIHESGTSSQEQSSQEKEDLAAQNQVETALNVFENGEDNANGISVELDEARNTIFTLLGNDCGGGYFGKHFETVYAAAQAYEEKGFYGKAYWLYDVLSYYNYEETLGMAERCYDKWFLKQALRTIIDADDNNPNLRMNISTSLDTITQLYYTSNFAEPFKQIVYDEAIKLKQNGEYHKAYYLFEELANIGFLDSVQKRDECKNQVEG